MNKIFLVVFERVAEDNWGSWVPDIPGAVGVGDSKDAARMSVLAGITFQLEYAVEMGEPLPEPTSQVLDVSGFDTNPDTGHYEIEWLLVDLAPYATPPLSARHAA